MIMNKPSQGKEGLFVVLEGIGGVGKTTVRIGITQLMSFVKVTPVHTREPGGTGCAEHIRTLVKEGFPGTDEKMSPMGVALLFNAARADHMAKVIQPALDNQQFVLCDRFCDSTFTYQHVVNGLPLQQLYDLHELVIGRFPDMTFILDAPAEVAAARLSDHEKAHDQFDRAAIEQQEAMRQAYLTLARENPHRYCVVDATKSKSEVFDQITPKIDELIQIHLKGYPPQGIRSTLVG